jgi:hypothetical protein
MIVQRIATIQRDLKTGIFGQIFTDDMPAAYILTQLVVTVARIKIKNATQPRPSCPIILDGSDVLGSNCPVAMVVAITPIKPTTANQNSATLAPIIGATVDDTLFLV